MFIDYEEEDNNFRFSYRHFIYIFIILHILINHSFSKICVILDVFLDKKLSLPSGMNNLTFAVSTILSALGKFIGIYISGSKKKIIVWSFFFNGVFLLFCVLSKSTYIFFIVRSVQGFVAGLQNSVLFGLLGTLKDCKSGFRNFTTISGVVSLLTGCLLYYLNPINMIYGLVVINIFSFFLFWIITPIKDKSFSFQSIDWQSSWKIVQNKEFFLRTIFLGSFLGFVLLAIGQQKYIIMNYFNIKFDGLSNILSSITFLSSIWISFFSNITPSDYSIF